MSEETTIQVNFGKPLPLFPLDAATLLPHQLLPLHIFEPRYRQMVDHALDGPGQIAMAVFAGHAWKQHYHARPPLRQAVCVGQIVQHERLTDGRYNLMLQGVCRAQIIRESPPSAERLYREALLRPVGVPDEYQSEDPDLYGLRERLSELLSEGPLTQLKAAPWVLERVRNEEIPAAAILELVSFTLVTDAETKYKLLAEQDAATRAELVEDELLHLRQLLDAASHQHAERWPKGCSWN